jgi:hypothetical protein
MLALCGKGCGKKNYKQGSGESVVERVRRVDAYEEEG